MFQFNHNIDMNTLLMFGSLGLNLLLGLRIILKERNEKKDLKDKDIRVAVRSD